MTLIFEKINWDTWSTPSNESGIDFKFIECIRDSFLFQHVNKPTRACIDHEPHILDIVLTNEEGMISNIEHLSPLGKIDHSLLQITFNCYIQQANNERVKYYYDQANLSEMGTELLAMNWDKILSVENINEQWTIFKDIIMATRDKHVPKRTG